MDILWVRPYLTPQMILSLLLKIFEKYRIFEEGLNRCAGKENLFRP